MLEKHFSLIDLYRATTLHYELYKLKYLCNSRSTKSLNSQSVCCYIILLYYYVQIICINKNWFYYAIISASVCPVFNNVLQVFYFYFVSNFSQTMVVVYSNTHEVRRKIIIHNKNIA